MTDKKNIDTGRRELLKGLGTAAVAGTLAAGITRTASAAEPQPEVKTEKKAGYHETQHIRDYYDTL